MSRTRCTTLHGGVAQILLSFTSKSDPAYNPKSTKTVSPFIGHKLSYTSLSVPSIPLSEYIERISKLSFLTDETLLASLVYIDRILATGSLVLTRHELHRYGEETIILAFSLSRA